MGWTEFALAFAVFFASHGAPVRPPLRPWLEARLGARGFTIAYSAVSLAVLSWLIGAAGRAPYVLLWGWAPWQAHVVLAAMLAASMIVALAVARPNPFSFGGTGNERFDPARAGIVRVMRHPFLVVLALWAGAHILPNGDLAHVLVFGAFAVFALAGGPLVARRKRRNGGPAELDGLRAHVLAAPLIASFPPLETGLRLVGGGLVYAGLIALHPLVFGVSPFP